MTSDRFKRALSAAFANQPRHCSQCCQQRPRAGGREITYNRGKNARWVCGDCAESIAESVRREVLHCGAGRDS